MQNIHRVLTRFAVVLQSLAFFWFVLPWFMYNMLVLFVSK